MGVDGGVGQQGVTPPLPSSIRVVALAGLARFSHPDWYAWQRTKPSVHDGASIGHLVAIGVLVGVMGGITGSVDVGLAMRMRISIAER